MFPFFVENVETNSKIFHPLITRICLEGGGGIHLVYRSGLPYIVCLCTVRILALW